MSPYELYETFGVEVNLNLKACINLLDAEYGALHMSKPAPRTRPKEI